MFTCLAYHAESLPKLPMNTQSVCVVQCREAVQDLRAAVRQAKFHRAACCQVFAAALAAQLALEHSAESGILNSGQSQQQQRLCASLTAAIELAQQRIQVFGSRSVVLRYAVQQTAGRRWKQSALQKLQAVTLQLDALAQQVWNLQTDANDRHDRYHPEVRQCLECFLPPDSAKEAAAAVASLTWALVSGLQEPGQLLPKLAALRSGQLQVTSDQAIEVLAAFQTLLGATPAGSMPQAGTSHAPPGRGADDGRQHASSQVIPAFRSQALGQISSLYSAQSHAQHTAGRALAPFDSGSTELPSVSIDTSAGTSGLNMGHVTRAMPPPPSHAEHALDQQKRRPQLGQASQPKGGSSWQSPAVEAHQRLSSMSEQQAQGIASRQHSQSSCRGSASPFDTVRSLSYAQDSSPQPSNASELSQEGASRLPSHTSNTATISPFNAVRRQSSVQEGPCLTHAGPQKTSDASVQPQTGTGKPQQDMGQGGIMTRPSARATHSPYANTAASATSQSDDEPRQGVTSQDSPEAQRFSRWADAQMVQLQKNADGSADFRGRAQFGLAAMSGQDRSRLVDQPEGQSKETRGGKATSSTSAELNQPASVQASRRSSMELFENLNCPIIKYDQLQIKRKIGDGSIGLVYLGKWQETDVAVKVLLDMQHLAPSSQVQPQDPATLQPWKDSPQPNAPEQQEEDRVTVQGLQGVTGTDGSMDGQSQAEESNEATAAFRTMEREVSIISSLRHPNVVMFMGLCLQPPCIVTEFCARGSLYDVLRKARTSQGFAQQLDWSKRLSMALDAAKGVLHLHSHKPSILHRDLKSPNMLVERHWRVKVTDFNLSRMVQTSSPGSSIASLLANNPRWLAPEVVEDHQYSKAADVYSFGIIMWEMMTWDMPWEDLNAFQIMVRLSKQERPEIPDLEKLPGQPLPGIDDYICLMKECWSQDPSKRPGFEHIIILIRGLLEGAASKQKVQKTLTEVPRLATSCMVPACMNKLPVAGQNAHKAAGPDPQETPTPLHTLQNKRTPLQVYETNKPFFGSAPVGGLDILCSHAKDTGDQLETVQYHPLSGATSQQAVQKGRLQKHHSQLTRRHTYNGTPTAANDIFESAPHFPPLTSSR